MKIEIKHWLSGSVLATQDVPDDAPQPMRVALEALSYRGQDPDELRRLKDMTEASIEDMDGDDDSADEIRSLRYRVESIDRELAAPSVRASLVGARLDGASLDGASLDGARWAVMPTDAVLARARADMRAKLAAVSNHAPGLLAAIRAGRVDGATYTGECSCLVGTFAKLMGVNVDYVEIPGLPKDSSSPIEQLFFAIRPGHTPERNPVAAWVEAQLVEWIAEHPVAGGAPTKEVARG
jgi:hypothetical protein